MDTRWGREVVAGAVAGVSNQTLCHPFDTVRTRLQADPHRRGALAVLRLTVSRDGVRGLYRGMTPPLAAQAVYKAVLFSTHGASRAALERHYDADPGLPGELLCGALSGAVNSLVVTPVELVRNQLMMVRGRQGSSPAAVLREAWTVSGRRPARLLRLLYRGWPPTVLRDASGVAMWFTGFHVGMRVLVPADRRPRLAEVALSGALGGLMFWTVALPWDTVKSRVQASPLHEAAVSTVAAARRGGLYRGWPVAFGRGLPGAAVTLTVHHEAYAWLTPSRATC